MTNKSDEAVRGANCGGCCRARRKCSDPPAVCLAASARPPTTAADIRERWLRRQRDAETEIEARATSTDTALTAVYAEVFP